VGNKSHWLIGRDFRSGCRVDDAIHLCLNALREILQPLLARVVVGIGLESNVRTDHLKRVVLVDDFSRIGVLHLQESVIDTGSHLATSEELDGVLFCDAVHVDEHGAEDERGGERSEVGFAVDLAVANAFVVRDVREVVVEAH